MTTDETNYLIERLKVLCADMTELLNQATEEIRRIEQTFDKPPKCLGCLYSDLDKAFHPCASCVDFGKYVGEVSGKTEPSFTATDFGKGTITKYTDEPQTDCAWK